MASEAKQTSPARRMGANRRAGLLRRFRLLATTSKRYVAAASALGATRFFSTIFTAKIASS